ncbi:hypothetical protein [Pseudoalteromonas sp. S558]|uniref:hypothetical protein n=1 Tax=Pseudoalteromonas sp. S558 TaxID=2066515 RepID=UPI00110BD316|nr:hypothetical protein [Pseudoalteromonas sp. S558]TMO02913.1 hypothetical protein CWB66_12310 [Pseudoalteromonas sp. S558]
MYYFDEVIEEEINGRFYLSLKNSEVSEIYYPDKPRISKLNSGFEGCKLKILSSPEVYCYQGVLNTKEEMDELSNNIMEIIQSADFKNNSILFPPI